MKARVTNHSTGRIGVGLALAASTVAAMTVPAGATSLAPVTQQQTAGAGGLALATAPTLASAPRSLPQAPRVLPQAPEASSYRVRAGDTVSHIAARTGTSVSAIINANNLSSRALITAGQTLRIPAAGQSTPAASTSSAAPGSHTVVPGDTVWDLANRYGITVSAITSANNLDSRALVLVGQQLTIPGASSAGSSTSAGSSSSAQQTVGNTFLGRTYAPDVVSDANANKASLVGMDVPSRDQMRAMVRDTAATMGVDPSLALAVAYLESGFNARAVSPANAVGVMQVIPSSGDWASQLVGRELNILDPQDNVTAGVAILRQLLGVAPDFDTAVAGYYQGLAGVTRNGMYSDTRSYVANIKSLMGQF